MPTPQNIISFSICIILLARELQEMLDWHKGLRDHGSRGLHVDAIESLMFDPVVL